MPIYEFACDECGHGFERLQRLSDADPVECPACQRPSVRRRLSAPSFRLAGGGWYETDFKGEGDRKRNLAGSDSAGVEAGKSADKEVSKPAPSTESKPAPVTSPATPAASAAAT